MRQNANMLVRPAEKLTMFACLPISPKRGPMARHAAMLPGCAVLLGACAQAPVRLDGHWSDQADRDQLRLDPAQ